MVCGRRVHAPKTYTEPLAHTLTDEKNQYIDTLWIQYGFFNKNPLFLYG
jgi:hypothetical protein